MVRTDDGTPLSREEIDALARAASWYASYFAREISAEADDTHAYAVEERRAYLTLLAALHKLGVPYPVPDALRRHTRDAA